MADEPVSQPSVPSLLPDPREEPSTVNEGIGKGAPHGPADRDSAGAPGRIVSPPKPHGRWRFEIAIAVVVVIAAIVATYAVIEMNHKPSSSSGGTVVVPAGTLYSLPVDQYNAVIFSLKAPATVEGTITNVGGAQLYVMNPGQYLHLVLTYNVSGYEWTSGPIPSDTYYDLSITIPSGSWDLVFSNSVPGNSTAIGIYSNLVEYP